MKARGKPCNISLEQYMALIDSLDDDHSLTADSVDTLAGMLKVVEGDININHGHTIQMTNEEGRGYIKGQITRHKLMRLCGLCRLHGLCNDMDGWQGEDAMWYETWYCDEDEGFRFDKDNYIRRHLIDGPNFQML